ncbi:GNAT family N-acetyltransferase [Shewanella pealeana]|uniref:GCN5-related N-acetyltransferase n=1 Tax=Shewanella pealeana (strain ATCC 700345 / ANG-SQ1) TaxID=398579 RepID=A8GYV0_SHEPA|nr:N-acetyltransferase [Shewanella pealeana]ABV85487.1 GCN5-related N-acetyltransferase [Shewanella pealeana ATCC 700345]
MNDPIELCLASKPELTAIDALEQQCFAGHCYPDFFFRQALDCWANSFWIAKNSQGIVIGYLLASTSAQADTCWILSVAVADTARGQGIGGKLISQLISALPPEVNYIHLTVAPDNPAKALYSRHGFTEYGFESDYFGESEPRVVMRYVKSAPS